MSKVQFGAIVGVLCLLGAISAQVQFNRPCPTIQPVINFNLTEFQGEWYELSRYDYPAAFGSECVYMNMILNDRTLNINNTMRAKDNKGAMSTAISFDATAIFNDKNVGTFNYTQTAAGLSSICHITLTDYKNFAIIRTCAQVNSTMSLENAFILGRHIKLEGTLNVTVESYIKTMLSPNDLHRTIQDKDICVSSAMSITLNVMAFVTLAMLVTVKNML